MNDVFPIQNSTLDKKTTEDSPSMGSEWYYNVIPNWSAIFPTIDPFDENAVFHVELEHTSNNYINDIPWKIRIGKGGNIYSIVIPGTGECIPPQYRSAVGAEYRFAAPWCEDAFVPTLMCSQEHIEDAFVGTDHNTFASGEVHCAGMYVKPYMDAANNAPFYCPLLLDTFNQSEKSYSTINIGLVPTPSVNRGDVVTYNKYRDVGGGIIEITTYFYNFGELTYDNINFTWGSLRASKFPTKILGRDNNTFSEIADDFMYFLDGSNTTEQNGSKYNGWTARTSDINNEDSITIGHVQGTDMHFIEQSSLSANDPKKWQTDKTYGRGIIGSLDVDRDCTFNTTVGRVLLKPGSGFFVRYFLVIGKLGNVVKKCDALVNHVDFGAAEFTEQTAGKFPLYKTTKNGYMVATNIQPTPSSTPIGYSLCVPTKNSVPLFLLKNKNTGEYSVSTDHYLFCGKKPFVNPYPAEHINYSKFENRYIYQIYDGNTEWTEFLGFVLPLTGAQPNNGFQKLSTAFNDIAFSAGEKLSAEQLVIYDIS